MTRSLRRFAAACLALAGLSLPGHATSYGTDFTDLWFNPAEPGWGVNLIQQYETLFATLFVYGADGTARWFVASDLRGGANNTFTGPLYRTTGPAFSGVWSGNAVATPVGNMTFAFSGASNGTLTYSVDGTTVTRQVQRQTWRANDIAGNFVGGLSGTASSCNPSSANGNIILPGLIVATHGGGNPTMRLDYTQTTGAAGSCTFSGTYVAAGRLGSVTNGTFTCNNGANNGTFTLTEVDVTRSGMSAVFSGNDGFCTLSGAFGGIRRGF